LTAGFTDPAWITPVEREAVALGGRIRAQPEDFYVEEIPLLRPAGRGDHVLFQIEKREMSTFDAILRVSKGAKVSEQKVGYAGLKDAQAVTRQYLTVHKVPPERVLGIEHPRMRVLTAARHTSPLKLGFHRGNRFTIRIRGADAGRVPAARRALERFTLRGMPNAYGAQRFGIRRDGHEVGRAVVHEDWQRFLARLLGEPSPLERDHRVVAARQAYDAGDLQRALGLFPLRHRLEKKALSTLLRTGSPREAFLALGRRPRRIWVAAWQSYLFNRILDRRVREGTYDRLLPGDIGALHASGAFFPVREAAHRADAAPTGPLVGYDQVRAGGEPGRIEREVLAEHGADPEAFRADHVRARGHRRPLSVRVHEASLEVEDASTVRVRFVLPPGCFATVLLEALMAGPTTDPAVGAGPG
jgi:tRNA pseudouridine13 synthase